MKCIKVTGFLVLAQIVGCSAFAADAAGKPENVIGASVEYSVVDKGEIRFQGQHTEGDETHSINPVVYGRFGVTDKIFLPVGVTSRHLFLDSAPGIPLPDRINTMRLSTGLGYRIDESWTVEASAGPLFYDLERVESRTIGFGAFVRGTWKASDTMIFVGGLGIAPDAEIPVFPVVGAIWKVRPDVTLNLIAPKPCVIYGVNDWINVYAGADVRFDVFRTPEDFDRKTGVVGFNNALGTYRDVHLGAGADFRIVNGLRAGFEAGYSVSRLIDYTRIDEKVRFENAPYVQAGVKYQF